MSINGILVLRTGKVELGQGILTALAQIAAEELRVLPSQIAMRAASTLDGPDEGLTVGGLSVEQSGPAMRFVAACAHDRLLTQAANRMGLAPRDLLVRGGMVWHSGQKSKWSYWTLAREVLSESVSKATDVPIVSRERYKFIGTDVLRLDLAAKFGGGAFIQDLQLPGMLHAKVLRQPSTRAKLAALDTARMHSRHPDATIVRNGDFVACVAKTESQAQNALKLLQKIAQWQTTEKAESPRAPIGRNVAEWLAQQPSTETVLEPCTEASPAASVALEGVWSRPFLAHASIGLCISVAWLRDDRLEIWTHSQGVFTLRNQIARVLQRPAESVVLHHMAGAGCYGHNGADDVALDSALAAIALPGVPIRVQWSREDELCKAPFGGAMAVQLQVTLDERSRISSWSTRITSTSHATRPGMHGEVNLLAAGAVDPKWWPVQVADASEAIGGGASRNARPIYEVGTRALTLALVESPVRTSAIRSLGAHANVFAIEGMMDELAAAAKIDAIQFRRQHLTDTRAIAVLDRVVDMSGWNQHSGDGTAVGLGLARYKNRGAYCAVVVEIDLGAAVSIRRVWCAVDAGQLVNPDGARNQIEGGVVQSISWTLKEFVPFEGTQPLCTGWTNYPILRFGEVPVIETEFIGAASENASLGVGEAAAGPTAAAIGNAVSRALGVRARNQPLDRDRLLELLA